jgi:hypothetical protein
MPGSIPASCPVRRAGFGASNPLKHKSRIRLINVTVCSKSIQLFSTGF